jgi:hypothetical protein
MVVSVWERAYSVPMLGTIAAKAYPVEANTVVDPKILDFQLN